MKELRRLAPYLAQYPKPLLLGFISLVLAKGAEVLAPQILKLTVDDLTVEVTVQKLALYGGAIVCIAMVVGFFRFWMRRLLIGVSRHVEYDLRGDFFCHLQVMSPSFYQRWRTGDLMSRASSDISSVRMVIGPGIMYPLETLIITVGAIGFMLTISWQLTLVALSLMPIVSLAVKWFGSIIHERFERIQEKMSDISALVQENLAGIRVVRAYVQEDYEREKFRVENDEYFRRQLSLAKVWGAFHPLLTSLIGLGTALVLWLGGKMVISHEISLGELVAFFAYLNLLTWPMIAFGWVVNIYQRGAASMKRLTLILDETPEFTAIDTNEQKVGGRIEFKSVGFSYSEDNNKEAILKGIDLAVEPGQTIAFIGSTGSGKSTLVQLIPRLYDVTEGAVLVGGHDVRTLPLEDLRRAVGFVPQDSFLFSESIRDNIAFGCFNADDELVQEAAHIAGIRTDISEFPDGFNTFVGERGVTLSGGQRQRTTIARALIVGKPILILDDVFSAVDTETEDRIMAQLDAFQGERTILLVSHRISTVKNADNIYVLERGVIVEHGTHEELVACNGPYRSLHEKQKLEAELERI